MSTVSEFPFDAWIGAASEDETVVARLGSALGRKGLKIARRPRHTTAGEIVDGLAKSRRLLACVSDSYLDQPAGQFELDFARHLLPGGDQATVIALAGGCQEPVSQVRADLREGEDFDSGVDRIAYWLERVSTEESSEEEPLTTQQLVERAIACQTDDPNAIFRVRLAAEALLRGDAGEARPGATTASLIEARLEGADAQLASALDRLRASDSIAVNEKGQIKGIKARDVKQLIDAVRTLARKPGEDSGAMMLDNFAYPAMLSPQIMAEQITMPPGWKPSSGTLHALPERRPLQLADYEVGELLERGPTWRRYRASLKGSKDLVFLTKNMEQRLLAQNSEASGWRRFCGAMRTAFIGNSSEHSSGETPRAASPERDRLIHNYDSRWHAIPAICDINAAFQTEEGITLISEYAEGNSLRDLLSTGPLAISDAQWIFPIIAEAIDKAYEPRDIYAIGPRSEFQPWPVASPDYVLVTGDNQIRLLGYDILESPSWNRLLNSWPPPPGAFYVAPEQFAGTAPDLASSQYSIAVMLYEALTGYRLHRCESVAELAKLISTSHDYHALSYNEISSPDSAPEISVDFRIWPAADAFNKALSRNPSMRFDNCREFVTAALAAIDSSSQLTQKPSKRS